MISSFGDKETEKIWNQEYSRKLPREIQGTALRKLIMIHRSVSLADLRMPPANRLERLSGDREGQYSIRINDQWRICFQWVDGNAQAVHIVDYH
ncbi:MAG: type II toxin-antitoxin system RelE/ParE family toxin [Treponema sp.]|nr:type II toxin-antitoxin system RelE/ParE family toxin [Treponema sp.]